MRTAQMLLALLLMGLCSSVCFGQDFVPCYRLVRVANAHQEHFYTTDASEKQEKINEGYVLESSTLRPQGRAFYLSSQTYVGAKPVYRLRKAGSGFFVRLYTTNDAEKDLAQQSGYVYERIIGYISAASQSGMTAVYRAYKSSIGDRFYTVDYAEHTAACNDGYVQETILGYTHVALPVVVSLTRITLNASPGTSEVNQTVSVSVTGEYSNGVTKDVTTLCVVSSGNTSVVKNVNGVWKAVGAGDATLKATLDGQQSQKTVHVNAVVIVTPPVPPQPAPVPQPVPVPVPAPVPTPQPEVKSGGWMEFMDLYASDEVMAETYLYLIAKFVTHPYVKYAISHASWNTLDGLNLDMDTPSLWDDGLVDGKDSGIHLYLMEQELYRDEYVLISQQYQWVLVNNPSRPDLHGQKVLYSWRRIQQRRAFSFTDVGKNVGLVRVDICNDRFVRLVSVTHENVAQREDESFIASPSLGSEQWKGSVYTVSLPMLDLEGKTPQSKPIRSGSLLEDGVKQSISGSKTVLHLVTDVFMKKNPATRYLTTYLGQFALTQAQNVANYVFKVKNTGEGEEAREGFLTKRVNKLDSLDHGFMDKFDIQVFLSDKSRRLKTIYGLKGVSGWSTDVTTLLDEAEFVISWQEMWELIKEGKFVAMFNELAADFAGTVIASTTVSAGVSGMCAAGASTGPGDVVICGAALAGAPIAYLTIGNTTYRFVKQASVRTFNLVFDGVAVLFDAKKVQTVADFLGFDWVWYEPENGVYSQSSASRVPGMVTPSVSVEGYDVLSSQNYLGSQLAWESVTQSGTCIALSIPGRAVISVVDASICQLVTGVPTDYRIVEVSFKRIRDGFVEKVKARPIYVPTLGAFSTQSSYLRRLVLERPVTLDAGDYEIRLSLTTEGQLFWLQEQGQVVHAVYGTQIPSSSSEMSCAMNGQGSSTSFLGLLWFLVVFLVARSVMPKREKYA